jgi:bis(5'-nucleosidyl)-tetraphosphatase
MPVERSAGMIIFRNTPEGRRYLIIRASQSHIPKPDFWDFPKGILEKGETGLDAAEREAKEEVGIEDFELIPHFKETVNYFTRREGKPVPKFVAMFLAEVKNDKVNLSWEHDKYEWLRYEEAYKRISLPQMKKVLEKAEKFLNK